MLIVISASLAQSSCDAQSAAIDLFASKGLNLLGPARDYIKPGGLFFVPPKPGIPDYDDPADPVTAEPGNLMNFQADIMQETKSKTSKLSAVLAFAKAIVPLSFGAGAENDTDVSLKEISTTGVRLTTNALDALIQQPNTKKSAYDSLDPKDKVRVFVVQEVYKARTLDLSASSGKAFALTYDDSGKPVEDCGTPNNGAKSDDSTKKSTDTTSKSTNTTSKASDTSKAAATSNKSTSKASNTPGATDGTAKLQAGLSGCISQGYTLIMNAADPIPFAVRLAELERYGTAVRRSHKGKPVYATLGSKTEIGNGVVSESGPIATQLTHNRR
jgi:hypothetical protein